MRATRVRSLAAPVKRHRWSWRLRLRRVSLVGLASMSACWGASALTASVASANTESFTTAGCSTWTAPGELAGGVAIKATGAAGGAGQEGHGGRGDGISATLSGLSGGSQLRVCVDVDGGAAGGSGASGGGGASGVSLGSGFSQPVVVAGGGGGGGACSNTVGFSCVLEEEYFGGKEVGVSGGGSAGNPNGQTGSPVCYGSCGVPGGGGSSTQGGSGGSNTFEIRGESGTSGEKYGSGGPGAGGRGGKGEQSGGGGGAGYYGGGGGSGASKSIGEAEGGGSGGGGSDFCGDTYSGGTSIASCGTSSGAGTSTGAGSAAGAAQVILTYTLAGPPEAKIESPSGGGLYSVGQNVATKFSCSDANGGPGIESCSDSNGSGSPGKLNTSGPGEYTYTVTAKSKDGQTATTSIKYKVAAAPEAKIESPSGGGLYSVGQNVATKFSCSDANGGPGIESCSDSNGSGSPGKLNTSGPGEYTYTVTAKSKDGQTATTSIKYKVAAAPEAKIESPSGGGIYSVGQSISTQFSCKESFYGPGIESCSDSNGSGSPGKLNTSGPGEYTYTVTAKSKDGQTATTSIKYKVAAAPEAKIESPSGGGIYSVGQSISTQFSCKESFYGPGIESCSDSNGSGSPGKLNTSGPGEYTYTVTAKSKDGQTATTSIAYTVAAAPEATVESPFGGGIYSVGQSVPTKFSCNDGAYGPGIASCEDSNGSQSPGQLNTSKAGEYTYTVSVKSTDGQTATASITYTVAAAPEANIEAPASGGIYSVGQNVPTKFSCNDGAYGPGIASCEDSNGSQSPGQLNTSKAGEYTYTVSVKSTDGQTATAGISYMVAAAPEATVESPSGGGIYSVGQSVPTKFSCNDGAYGPGLESCSDSNGSQSPGQVNTSKAGEYTYTVTAESKDGQTATASITYTVAAAPEATVESPSGGGIYSVGQNVPTKFSCNDGAYGPGIASCEDSNGSQSPGQLNTSKAGEYSYTVTAKSKDGQTATASIAYTVAAAPEAKIESPSGGGIYSVGQSVPTKFSCKEGAYGPGLESCSDSNGSQSPGQLNTSKAGEYTYTVTAKSKDGQTATASIAYTVAAAPEAKIESPSGGGIYSVGQSVPTKFSCKEGAYGPGIASCEDSNGSQSPGQLNTSKPGEYTYTVTAKSKDGQTATANIAYTVAAAPEAKIESPSGGGIYSVGQSVPTKFSCKEGAYGPGLESCSDSNGSQSPGQLNTSKAGEYTYTVTAKSKDGQTATASISYTVAAAPEAKIESPSGGGFYSVGQKASTKFSCKEGAYGPGIASCEDSNGSQSPGQLNTSKPGEYTYTVTAKSKDGQTATASITYTVAAAPEAKIESPAGGGFYSVGQKAATKFSCKEGAYGPGIASCEDSNGSQSPGQLNTSKAGEYTYTVTAKSKDGQTATSSIAYTVYKPLAPTGATACNGIYGGSGNEVTVGKGETCILLPGTRVAHNVQVNQGGTLIDRGATIEGNLQANSAVAIQVSGGSVGQTLQIKGLTGSHEGQLNYVCGVKVGHNLDVENAASTAAPIDVGDPPSCAAGDQVGQDVNVTGNAVAVDVSHITGEHDINVNNNTKGVTVENNTDSHDVNVTGNSGGATVKENAPAHNVNVTNNSGGVLVRGNKAGEELIVTGNSGGVTVTANGAGNNAICNNNLPKTEGGENTATKGKVQGCPTGKTIVAAAKRTHTGRRTRRAKKAALRRRTSRRSAG